MLAPLMVPGATPQTDVVSKLFSNPSELHCILTRHKKSEVAASVDTTNKHHHLWQLHEGETVFRKIPPKARAPKHSLGVPSSGLYEVVGQSFFSSVQLKDLAMGKWVDNDAYIPLEQILAGPCRQLAFGQSQGERSTGDLVAGTYSGLTLGLCHLWLRLWGGSLAKPNCGTQETKLT